MRRAAIQNASTAREAGRIGEAPMRGDGGTRGAFRDRMAPMKRRDFIAKAGVAGSISAVSGRLMGAEEEIRVGMIGVGGRGSAHLTNLLRMPDVRIVAICDNDPEHLAAAQAKVVEAGKPKPDGYADWRELLERQDIRAVVSALPIHLHARNYQDVIAAAKDLYAEKPLARTVAECDAVAKAAANGDSVVMIGFQRRAHALVVNAVAKVHGGELGDLVEGRIQWSNTYGPMGGWYGRREQSGDWMLEQACHNWDVMNWVNRRRPVLAVGLGRDDLFRDTPVMADHLKRAWAKQPDRDVHDYYAAVVQYENGVLVNILHSWISPALFSGEFTRVVGTRGGVDFNTGTFSYRRDQKREDWTISQRADAPHRDVAAMRAFLDSVRSRKTPPATVDDGREAALTSMLVREAVYRKQPVTMKELLAGG